MRKSDWIIFITILVVVAGYFGYRSYTRTHARLQREQLIFCKTLVEGMTQEKVFDSLKTFGKIDYTKADVSDSGYDEIALGYTDSQVVGQKTYILSFNDGKYTGVSVIVGLENVDAVCKE
jgi:hypothetical protein